MMVIFNSPLISISIHAPREGCDSLHVLEKGREPISIHAPREGCDGKPIEWDDFRGDFNPRTPRGVRLSVFLLMVSSL